MKLAFLLNIYLEMMEVWMDFPWIQFFIDFDFTIIYVINVSFCFSLNNVGPSRDTKVHVMENAQQLPPIVPQGPLEVLYTILNL